MSDDAWMDLLLRTTILGAPAAKGSPRVMKTGRTFPHKKSAEYIQNVAQQLEALWMGKPPLDCAIHVMIGVVLPRPQRLFRKKDPDRRVFCTKKPDIDNFAKSVLDAVTKSGVWVDDGLVCSLQMTKSYADKSEDPCVELSIWRAE